jgi:hypothetical protein
MKKPVTAAGYEPAFTSAVRATCLYVATKLGDLADDTVVVGGLVPSLIIDAPSDAHVGTMDLDVGLALAVFDHKRYQELAERLRQAGFGMDKNDAGNPTRQRWQIDGPPKVTVDFLIPPSFEDDRGGTIRDIEPDFAAIIAPGLKLAFIDQERIKLEGRTIRNERASREIRVCGPAAFVAMKALALRLRGENKDAYDLWYTLQHFGASMQDVVAKMALIREQPEAVEGMSYLGEDFREIDSIGPMRVAAFLGRDGDEGFRADVRGLVLDFVRACRIQST